MTQGTRRQVDLPPYFWVLNPDAELELSRGPGHHPPRALLSQIERRRSNFELLTQGEPAMFLHEMSRPNALATVPGHVPLFWTPTRCACEEARRVGLAMPDGLPDQSLLEGVFHRSFLSATGCTTVPERAWTTEWAELLERIRPRPSEPPRAYRLKRAFGFAGRGQRRVTWPLTPDDERFVDDRLRQGGVLVERDIPHARTYSIHGVVRDRSLVLGDPCSIVSDAQSAPAQMDAWHAVGADSDELTPEQARQIRTQGQAAANALRARGYEGPFGLDLLELDEGFCAIDLNPRFTLAWSLGMGPRRTAALGMLLSWARP